MDHFHDTVAIHAKHLPATQRTRFRPIRDKSKELTGGDGSEESLARTKKKVKKTQQKGGGGFEAPKFEMPKAPKFELPNPFGKK